MRALALLLMGLALVLTGCETTAEKSAKLEKIALRTSSGALSGRGLSIARPSAVVKVVSSAVLHSSEGSAVTITVRNLSGRAIANVPLAITVRDTKGSSVYSNSSPGLAHSLVALALIQPHAESTWIDDQISARGSGGSVAAEAGEGGAVDSAVPRLTLQGAHIFEEPGTGFGATGIVVNHSPVAQRELVVYATARRGSRVLAAGRAVVAQVPGGGSAPFELFFIGNPKGGQLELSAPPTTLG